MPSATLLPEDKPIIRSAIGHECQIFTATIARLYLAYPNAAQWTHICTGAIAFLRDTRRNNAFFLRLVNMQSGSVVWEQELFKDFPYYQERPFFHAFQTDIYSAGLSFADENEALAFYTKVQNRDNLRVQSRTSRPASAGNTIGSKQSSSASIGAGGNGPMVISSVQPAAAGRKQKGKIDKSKIGMPSNFRHLTHVGYDPQKGFSTVNVPPEWKKVFDQAGVTEDQLQDAKTAKFIFQFMKENYNASDPKAHIVQAAPSPPPIPSNRPTVPVAVEAPVAAPVLPNRRVPPPPPTRNQPAPVLPSRGAPPPPPPSRNRGISSVPPPPAPNDLIPPPPAGFIPPPPAPPSLSTSAPIPPAAPPASKPPAQSKLPVVSGERVDLMASIRSASTTALKHVTADPPSPEKNDLMASIRGAGGRHSLKSAVHVKEERPAAPSGDIAGALKAALMKRNEKTRGDVSSDSDNSAEQNDGDDDW